MFFILYCLIFLGLFCSINVISSRNSVHAVFYLILVFCVCACILLSLTIDFLAIIFIIVYVGAIAVLFLFIVMMLNIRVSQISESVIRYIPLVIIISIIFFSEIYYFLKKNLGDFYYISNDWIIMFEEYSEIVLLSNLLYTHFLFIFLLSGIILLLSMIGAICLTLTYSLNVKRQVVFKQNNRHLINSIYFYKYK